MVKEELAELNLELCRIPRNRHNFDSILEEAVDVFIMMFQLKEIIGSEKFENILDFKLKRLEERLNN